MASLAGNFALLSNNKFGFVSIVTGNLKLR
jgi:hypothetical protein